MMLVVVATLFFTFGPFIYRIKEDQLPLSPKRSYSDQLEDWARLRIRHEMTVTIEPGEQGVGGGSGKAADGLTGEPEH
jgi:hypothetical protein